MTDSVVDPGTDPVSDPISSLPVLLFREEVSSLLARLHGPICLMASLLPPDAGESIIVRRPLAYSGYRVLSMRLLPVVCFDDKRQCSWHFQTTTVPRGRRATLQLPLGYSVIEFGRLFSMRPKCKVVEPP